MGERIRAIWQHIADDIRRNPGLWIGVGLTAVVAIIAYVAYRNQQNSSQDQIPANGYGIPDYSSAFGGSDGGSGGGYAPYQPASPASPTAPIDSGGSTFPVTAAPAFPAFNLPVGGAAGFGSSDATPNSYTIAGNIQNPSAASELAHRALAAVASVTAPSLPLINQPLAPAQKAHTGAAPLIQNPTADAQMAHRGATTRQPQAVTVPHVNQQSPITTVRPKPTSGRGRAA